MIKSYSVMYINAKHTETWEQSQTPSSLSFCIVLDRPIQHFTSGMNTQPMLIWFTNNRATAIVELENTWKQLHKGHMFGTLGTSSFLLVFLVTSQGLLEDRKKEGIWTFKTVIPIVKWFLSTITISTVSTDFFKTGSRWANFVMS